MMFAAVMLSAQAGYCAGGALENLQKLGDVGNVSMPFPDSPVNYVEGNKLAADKAMARLSDLAGATPFEKLENLFGEGDPATKEDLTGWHSGRGVKRWAPETFFGVLIIGRDEPANPGGGPLFTDRKFVMVSIGGGRPDYYDSMTDNYIAELKKIPGMIVSFPIAEVVIKASNSVGTTQYRKARGYIVERYLIMYNDGKKFETYSYYFRNVTPKK